MVDNDWRLLRQQERYLMGVQLVNRTYSQYSNTNDHDHCEFCMDKFSYSQNNLKEGYCTVDKKIWICENCFNDFKDIFGWKVISLK